MSYGLTANGFNRKTLQALQDSVYARLQAKLGASINLLPSSVFGQIGDVMVEELDEAWEALEAIYHSAYPNSAFGTSLDKAVQYIGLTRLEGLPTTVMAVLTADIGTTIPSGTTFGVQGSALYVTTDGNATVDNTAVWSTLISVDNAVSGNTYSMTINGNVYSHVAGVSDTEADIAAALIALIEAGTAYVVVTDYTDGTFFVHGTQLFTSVITANMTYQTMSTITACTCTEIGPNVIPIGTLTNIVTPVSGLNSVNNESAGVVGRDVETDTALRIRRTQALNIAGAGTPEAIRARILQEVTGAVAVFVIENRTDDIDLDGRPPHSYECVVSGGSDADIAATLWLYGPAGIQTYGTELVYTLDSQGNTQVINFSRATPIYIWLNISIELYSEESFPVDGEAQIKDYILEYGAGLGIGNDVLLQRLELEAQKVPGIARVTITATSTLTELGPPGSYTTADIAISQSEISAFDLTRMATVIP